VRLDADFKEVGRGVSVFRRFIGSAEAEQQLVEPVAVKTATLHRE
jgi:hypothetical protein